LPTRAPFEWENNGELIDWNAKSIFYTEDWHQGGTYIKSMTKQMIVGREDPDMNQRGHMNQNPTETKIWLVLIHTAEGRPLIHIGAFSLLKRHSFCSF
jgi:hypothetical protein